MDLRTLNDCDERINELMRELATAQDHELEMRDTNDNLRKRQAKLDVIRAAELLEREAKHFAECVKLYTETI